jgi:hypothetical protein
MADRYVFADEAGNFDFSGARGASRYFILTSVTVADCSVGEQLLALRSPTSTHVVAFWPADSDPCIQIADYANWAIQRRWEQDDPSAHEQIAHLIRSEYDAWP